MKTVSKSLRCGGVNWRPPFPESEDERSIEMHKATIKEELKKKSPDKDKIKARMMLTFPDRRRLTNKKTPLVDIMNEHPGPFYNDHVQQLFPIYIVPVLFSCNLFGYQMLRLHLFSFIPSGFCKNILYSLLFFITDFIIHRVIHVLDQYYV